MMQLVLQSKDEKGLLVSTAVLGPKELVALLEVLSPAGVALLEVLSPAGTSQQESTPAERTRVRRVLRSMALELLSTR